MGRSTMDNPEKLAVYDTQDEDKQKTQYGLSWSPLYADIKYTSINMEDDQHLYEGCLVNQTSDKIQKMASNITSFNLTDLAYWTYNLHQVRS
jgi:hypothetical protein